jgi:hypothetical protein
MGLGDFLMLIDRMGWFGVFLSGLFVAVMFMGSVVDIYQFMWVWMRRRQRINRAKYNRIKAEVLLELHEKGKPPTR